MSDELTQFANWWLDTRPITTIVESHTIQDVNIVGTVLYREDVFQVQLFICAPNSIIQPHKHPNVDSFEIPHSGDITFTVEDIEYDQSNYPPSNIGQYGVRVFPNNSHHAKIGKNGGSFLSIQKWLNGVVPTSVGNDWEDNEGNTHGVCLPIDGEK